VRDYLLTLLVTAAVTYLLTPLVRRLAVRMGAIKPPRDRDVHVAPVPRMGGVAMYGGLAAGLLVASKIPQLRDGVANTGMVTGLLLAGGLLVAIGIVDDRWGMSALTKGAGQVAAGGILVATGTQLSWLPEPGGGTFLPTTVQSTLLTILVVVATINAVNFIDGLDGLAAGIVCIAAISFFAYYYALAKVVSVSALAAPALASAVLIGICLGFLPHNFSPASIFMGDTGSMLLGLLLAYAPISSVNSLDPAVLTSQINRYPVVMPLLLPAALLVIPYADLLLAVVRRTRAGKSPFAPDRKHLHHRLLDIGHSQRASVLIMYLWATMFSGIIVALSIEKTVHKGAANHHGVPVWVFVAVTAAAVAVLLLMSMPRLRWWQQGSTHRGSTQRHSQPAGRRPAVPSAPAPTAPAATAPAAELVAVTLPQDSGALSGPATAPQSAAAGQPTGVRPGVPAEPDGRTGLDHLPSPEFTVVPGGAGWAAPDRRSRLIRPPAVPADVTSPDLLRSWEIGPDLSTEGPVGANRGTAGQNGAGQNGAAQDGAGHDTEQAPPSVVGSVPPAVTGGSAWPGPDQDGAGWPSEHGGSQAGWFGTSGRRGS
jgi:UDP-GlcNAc:undecaprenyl-phosphate GlcNAc-1-phosphate transferase